MIERSLARIAALAMLFAVAPTASAQQAFPTPMEAAEALVDGIASHDDASVARTLGDGYRKYLPIATLDPDETTSFLEAWAQSRRIVPSGDAKAYLEVGLHGWTLPIPLVKGATGWSFDTAATADELRARRIGRNELAAIQVMLAYTDAQEEFNLYDRTRNGRNDYARRLISTSGAHDGLYWPPRPGEPDSPLGPLMAQPKGEAYHGYRYRILTAQGKDAPGGARGYVTPDGMTAGYALVAWPAKWGETGVMTFIVNQDKTVYQKDLGPDTGARVRALRTYNPDPSWTRVSVK
jgi:Protein of unknown function (DUF2950)